MDLPEFDPSGSGQPQGIRGPSPEEIASAQAQVGFQQSPEDRPAVQAVLASESDALAARLGIPQQAAAPVMQPASPDSQPGAAPQPPRETLADKIAKAKERFPDLDAMAEQLVKTRSSYGQLAKKNGSEIAELTNQVEGLNAQLAAVLTQRPPEPTYQRPSGNQPSGAVEPPAEEFFQNPMKHINDAIATNLMAYEEARSRQERARQEQRFMEEKASEIEHYRPLMAKIYSSKRDLYDGKPMNVILDDLLDRAKERVAAAQGAEHYRETIQALGETQNVANPQPGPGAASLGSGTMRAPNRPAPIQDYSQTAAMKKLWNSKGESIGEDRAIQDILRERGFGEHIG